MANSIGQQAAFIILDAAVAYGADTSNGSPMDLAASRLNDVPGMVTVTSIGSSPTVDVSPIVNASIVSTYVLAFWLAQERGVPIEEILAELRATHETLWDE
jgi:hypothetical protein